MAWTNRPATELTSGAPAPQQSTPPPTSLTWRKRRDLLVWQHRRRRNRQLAQWARRTAGSTPSRGRSVTRSDLLIAERVIAARADLIQIAAMLDQLNDPDPASTTLLRKLLSDGCESPLYNRSLHVSELKATLYYVNERLLTELKSTCRQTRHTSAAPSIQGRDTNRR